MKRMSLVFGRRTSAGWALALLLTFVASAFGGNLESPAVRQEHLKQSPPAIESGVASYYGAKYHGRATASGEIYDMAQLTAAHPRLAFGTRVKVTHLENNLSVIVRINDRGPFVEGRVIDLSQAAAGELQMVKTGLAHVKLEILE